MNREGSDSVLANLRPTGAANDVGGAGMLRPLCEIKAREGESADTTPKI